ncbi:MAG: tetratricopeptide repeat protein [Bacteroidota bacterium]|nr:tetratricopeptide repeat protein [Bacteroidota bacterium]MDP4206315.1 tetratricopeptide repeat protein [Bacteroidota bacterium]
MDQGAMEYFDENEIQQTVDRYLAMLEAGEELYFDVAEFEQIIEYFVENDDINSGKEALKRALSQHPTSISLQFKKATVLTADSQYIEALKTLHFIRHVEPDNSEVYLIAGNIYLLKEEREKAEDAFQKAIELSWENIDDTYFQIGLSWQQVGIMDEAEKYFMLSYNENPDNENVLFELAYCLEKNEKPEESIQYYNQYLDIDPYSATAWYNLGIVYNQMEEFDKAIDAYDYALAVSDDFISAIFNKANTLANANRYEEAIEEYQEYIKQDPCCSDAYLYIGECFFNLNKSEDALKYFQKCIRLAPETADAWYNAGRVMFIEKQFTEAYLFFRKALTIEPGRPVYNLSYANAADALGKRRLARRYYAKSVLGTRDQPQFWLLLAEFYGVRGKIDTAITILKKAHLKFGESTLISCRLAAYLLEVNDQANAMTYLEDALKIDVESYNDLYLYYPNAKQCEPINQLITQYKTLKHI